MSKTKGILLCAWGKVGYGYAAFNFAASIRYFNRDIPIHLIGDESALSHLQEGHRWVFSSIEILDSPVSDPGIFKVSIYDKLPFDYTLYLDVDAMCINDVEPLLNQLISDYENDDSMFYRTHVHDWYDKDSPEDFPMMYWATKSVIWNTYGFTDEKFPATQSSIQFIAKCDKAKQFYSELIDLMTNNPIPLDQLAHQWGGTQPDELYLNIQIAKSRIKPDINSAMWFCDNAQYRPHQLQNLKYTFLSYFGVKAQMKRYFLEYYDREFVRMLRKLGFANHDFKTHTIFRDKHANFRGTVPIRRTSPPNKVIRKGVPERAPQILHPSLKSNGWGREAFEGGRIFNPEPIPQTKVNGTIDLYLSNVYETVGEARKAELLKCLEMNCANESITTIYNFGTIPYNHPKVVNIKTTRRPTYQDFIDVANRNKSDYTIIINSDLYTDATLNWLDKIDMSSTMLALCRYDLHRNIPKLEAYSWSQGTWIFKDKINLTGMDFPLGLPGCENRFAFEAEKQGYKVYNPAIDIRTYHLHASNERTYTQDDRIHGDYKEVKITPIKPLVKPKVLINQPGAVGDIICVMPIAEHYYNQGYIVDWLAPVNYDSMFRQIPYVNRVDRSMGGYEKVIDLSFGINQGSDVHKLWMSRQKSLDSFVTLKYELAGVDLSVLRKIAYRRNEQREQALYDLVTAECGSLYSLVHSNSNYGNPATINSAYSEVHFRPYDGYTVFDWRKVIEGAKEIHAIDSSLANLVDCLNTDAELFYYKTTKVPNKWDETILVKDWKRIDQTKMADVA